jgi:4-amino-4-deoxy-L-arabinose transferase-like glycosyltransferase
VTPDAPLEGRAWWLLVGLVFALSLFALVPTIGDYGLTYDEPAYMYSQHVSAQWWERLSGARTWEDLVALLEPDALLYYWPYARHGINFHPPLAGQANLLCNWLFSGVMGDIPSRRLSSVVSFGATVALLFGFMARRYGVWAGAVAAGSLILMPRLYGQAHLIDTDIPGLFLWAAISVAFWKGLSDARGGVWRVLLGILLGLAFVEKMATVMVILPLFLWLFSVGIPRVFRRGGQAALLDGLLTLGLMMLPLCVALIEILRLAEALPAPQATDLHVHRPRSLVPGWVLAIPAIVWIVRRMMSRFFSRSPVWGVERPHLETVESIIAFAPLTAWLGNPEWWRETMIRLAHYYALNTSRRGALPDIQILYFGELFEFSLPWHNAWVLIGITVPASILAASLIGVCVGLFRARVDRLPMYFLLHLVTLPVVRMFPTPAHDGVRLFLPTFFFLAAFAGWGGVWFARLCGAGSKWSRVVAMLLVLGPAAWDLVRIHPYELSYYNVMIGGPRGAWKRGFELTYWYDAFTPGVIKLINERFPAGARAAFPNSLSEPTTFQELQAQGLLRGDIELNAAGDTFPYLWLLTHDSKASANSRLLFALRPWYTSTPRQLDGLRVATVADPIAAGRSLALQLLVDAPDRSPPDPPRAPEWVRRGAPWLARLWGDGLTRTRRLAVNERVFDWAKHDPQELRVAARAVVDWAKSGGKEGELPRGSEGGSIPFDADSPAGRLLHELRRFDGGISYSDELLRKGPEALTDAVEVLIRRPDAVRAVITRYGYTDVASIGGYLDDGLSEQ